MAFVHTAHGLGRIVASETLRGRTRHRVAGPGFEVWVDSTQVRTAGDSGYREQEMYHYDTTPTEPDDGDVYSKSPMYVERDASLGDINESNSTTLPYNPEPQYPTDMWAHETTIQPGDYEIDAEERLSPSDSLSFDSGRDVFPGPNPELFAKSAGLVDDFRDWMGSQEWTQENVEEWVRHHDPEYDKRHPKDRQANLGPKYASWMLASPESDDSVSRFRRDPIQEINRLGYLWTGGVEQPEMADYGRLIEADKMLREAAWADVRRKAQRLRREGRVHVLQRGPGTIYTNVDGDNGTYTTMIAKTGNTQSIDKWACSCEWGKWAFQRKISYVGRLCSHGYASYLELQSDDHKGNPGRFHAPRRTASLVDDFQDYVDDYRDGHVDIDAVDNFITLPEHNNPRLDADQVDDLYNWAWDNRTQREKRNYKVPYTAAAEDGPPRLRTTPRSLTPDLTVVPGPEESYFVDVEEDERETTGPGQIMHAAALVDSYGNVYSPSGFWRTADDHNGAIEEDETATSDVVNPGVATPRTPDSATLEIPDTDAGESPSYDDPFGGGGFDWEQVQDIATPIIEGIGNFAMPIAEGIGSAIGNFGSGLMGRGARLRTADCEDGGYHDGMTNSYVPEGKIEELREMANEDPELGNTREQTRQVQDAVDYLRDHGFDASPRVAGRYLAANCCEDCGCEAGCCDCDDCKCQGSSKTAAFDPHDDGYSHEYRDHSVYRHKGNGMYSVRLDGKGQRAADSKGGIHSIIDDHLDGSRREANYDSGPATVFGGPPGGAFGQPGGGPWADRSYSGSGPDPKWWYSDSEEAIAEHLNSDSVEQMDVTDGEGRVNHMPDSERPAQGKSAYRLSKEEFHGEPDYEEWEFGKANSGLRHHYEPDMDREGRRLYAADDDMKDELLQSLGEEIEGIGQYGQFLDEAQALGDEDAESAIEEAIADETEHVENFTDALDREAGKHDRRSIEDNSNQVNPYTGKVPEHTIWRTNEEGRWEEQPHWIDQRPAKHRAGMNDVVRQFQASGGGALAGGGDYADDAIAGQARKFLAKTAGRVYSLAEQQELVDESHPGGARNKPTDDDLAGTHYV